MARPGLAVEVFCSYAHEDEVYRQHLEKHVSLLKRQGLISLWHDREILAGSDWAQSIDAHLETASVVVLLISADFIASDYCYKVEMPRALERHKANEARVIPIVVRPCDWQKAEFAMLQSLPTGGKAVSLWESSDEAWTQVATGLRQVIEDIPLLAASVPRASLPATWMIPHSPNPFFLGRNEVIAQIHAQLQAGQVTALAQPQAISGLGGIGKTQIAVEYAYRYAQEYQRVLWANAESSDTLNSSYSQMAAALDLLEQEAQKQALVVQAVKSWLREHRGWLLILDNADELTLLKDFLPPVVGGHVLITTRASATGQVARRIEVKTLTEEQGALFLLRRAGRLAPDVGLGQASEQDQVIARELSKELGGLPLALDQAGAYLEQTGYSLGDYQRIYKQHRANLLGKRGELVVQHPEPVAMTWSLGNSKREE